jgi:hypothetical protein
MLWLPMVTQGSGCDLLKVSRAHADEVAATASMAVLRIPTEVVAQPSALQFKPCVHFG